MNNNSAKIDARRGGFFLGNRLFCFSKTRQAADPAVRRVVTGVLSPFLCNTLTEKVSANAGNFSDQMG